MDDPVEEFEVRRGRMFGLAYRLLPSARGQREEYVGPWLPEPIHTTEWTRRLTEQLAAFRRCEWPRQYLGPANSAEVPWR